MDACGWTDGRIRMDGWMDKSPDGRIWTDGRMDGLVEQPGREKGVAEQTPPREEKGSEGQEQPKEEKTGWVESAPRAEKGVEGQEQPGEEKGGKTVAVGAVGAAPWEEKGRKRSKPACKREGHKGESQARKKGLKATCEKEKQKAKVKGKASCKGMRKGAGKNRLRAEAGAEIVELVFGLVVAIALVTGFIALESGLNSMGGTALKIMDNRYAALAVTDMGLEGSEPGGIDAPDDGEEEVIPDDPDSGEGGSGGSGGTGEGDTGDEGELPDVEEEGDTGGDEYVDTDW